MVFSSPEFLVVFFPICFSVWLLLAKRQKVQAAKYWIIFCSFAFMAYTGPLQFAFFIAFVLVNFFLGRVISFMPAPWKKVVLIFSIVFDIGYLGVFKYSNFFIDNINSIFHASLAHTNIALPIGISFYTFQLIAYLVDSARGETVQYSLSEYLIFISFFPQLIIGPIIHHKEIIPQINKSIRIDYDNAARGMFVFFMGCFKKLIIADPLTLFASGSFISIASSHSWDLWLGALSYTVSFYFDLSSYADMAVGLGLMLNIKLPYNFHYPFSATNMADFWRRWHISLSRFLNDYIFRSVYRKGNKLRNYYVAVMATFFVSGFWHGAGWNFVLWGVLNGVLVCLSSYIEKKNIKFNKRIGWVFTMISVVFLRVLFVSELPKAIKIWAKMIKFSDLLVLPTLSKPGLSLIVAVISAIIILFTTSETPEVLGEKFTPNIKIVLLGFVFVTLTAISMGGTQSFLYFKF